MKTYDPNKPLYYCHIPRTGGAILSAQLNEMVGATRHVNEASTFGDPVSETPGAVIQSHWDYTVGAGVLQRHPSAGQFVTVLRDPFDRLVSWYFYIKNVWHGEVKFLDRQWVRLSDYGGTLAGFLRGYPSNVTRFLPLDVPIEDYVLVGVTSQLDQFRQALSKIIGAPCPPPRCGNQCGAHDEPITTEMRVEFQDKHPECYVLYNHALDVWGPVWNNYPVRNKKEGTKKWAARKSKSS